LDAGASTTISYNYIINSTPVKPGDPILTGTVPDSASTLALLGCAMVALAGISRRRQLA
jgi:hypothetical protein